MFQRNNTLLNFPSSDAGNVKEISAIRRRSSSLGTKSRNPIDHQPIGLFKKSLITADQDFLSSLLAIKKAHEEEKEDSKKLDKSQRTSQLISTLYQSQLVHSDFHDRRKLKELPKKLAHVKKNDHVAKMAKVVIDLNNEIRGYLTEWDTLILE